MTTMKFIFDENLALQLAHGMKEFGEPVLHTIDEFGEGVPDHEWLPIVGERGWYVITRDKRIRYRPDEISKYRENKVGGFVVRGKKMDACALIENVVRNWRKIKRAAAKTPKPFFFAIPPNGSRFTKIDIRSGENTKKKV